MNMQRIAFLAVVVLLSVVLMSSPVAAQTTLSGEIEINETVSDGERVEYEVGSDENVSDATMELTGHDSTSDESRSWSGLDDGNTINIDVNGSASADLFVEMSGGGTVGEEIYNKSGSPGSVGISPSYFAKDISDMDVYSRSDGSSQYSSSSSSYSIVSITDTHVAYGDPNDSTNVRVDKISDGSNVYTFTDPNYGVQDVAISDSHVAVAGASGDDGTVWVYDLSDGSLSHTITEVSSSSSANDVALSDQYVAIAGDDNTAYVNSLSDGSNVYTLTQSSNVLSAIDLSDDQVAYGGNGNTVWVHNLSDGGLSHTLDDPTDNVNGVGIAQNTVVIGSFDQNIYVYDEGTLKETLGQSDSVEDVAISDSADRLVAGVSSTGTILLNTQGSAYDPSLTIDGKTASYSGELAESQTHTETLSDVSTGAYSESVSVSDGAVDLNVSWTETTETIDPAVEISSDDGSQTIDHSGTISDGSTVDLSNEIDESRIGGDVTLSVNVSESVTDGPPGQVELDYSHGAEFSDADQLNQHATLDDQYQPSINDPTPADGGVLNNDTADVSALVSGGSLPIGGAVNVTISAAGNTDLDSTITSEQRVGTQLSTVVGGSNDWTVTAEDAQTGDTVSKTYSFNAPAQLEVRDESQPKQLISDGNISFTARFFGTESGDVFSRDVANGTADMTGLPVDQPLIVEVSANNTEYVGRRVLIESILQQQSIYLLPTNIPSAEVRFNINDQTGRFGDETTFFVEKPITRNNETEFRVISGDKLGPTRSFESVLENEERYRLRLVSPDGETRVLGDYRVSGAAVETLPIGQVEFSADINEGAAMRASIRPAPDGASHDHEARVVYVDAAGATSQISVSVVNSDGTAIRPTATEQLDGSDDIFVATYPLNTSFNPEQDSANVTVTATRNGETETFKQTIGDVPPIDFGPIPPQVLELMGFVSIVALIGLLVIVKPSMAALVGSGWAGLLTLVGVVPIPMPAVVLAGLVSVLVTVGTSGRLR